jgi:hypothetical protein
VVAVGVASTSLSFFSPGQIFEPILPPIAAATESPKPRPVPRGLAASG